MTKKRLGREDKATKPRKAERREQAKHCADPTEAAAPLISLQHQIGNQAVQRLIAQRSGEGPSDLDDEAADRINRARGGGQPLDGAVQAQMSEAMGYDFGGVRVHTDSEADDLNQQLQAKAFATGRDIFFKGGEYEPGSDSGRELIAHELSHVVQQGTGRVPGGGSGMTVRAAGDGFEQEAAAAQAQRVSGHRAVPRLPPQRQKEETTVQRALSKFDVSAAKQVLSLTEKGVQPTIAQDATGEGVPLSEPLSNWNPYFRGTDPVWDGSLQDLEGFSAGTFEDSLKARDYLQMTYGGGAYDEENKVILLGADAKIRDLRHELGHHKQALEGIKGHKQISGVLLEYHNIVKHENEPVALGDKLRVAYVAEPKYYGEHKDTNPVLTNWKTLMLGAEKKKGRGKGWSDAERRMMLELDVALKEAKYRAVPEGWNHSAGEIIKHMLGREIADNKGEWARLRN